MKISDIISQKVSLENLSEKKKNEKINSPLLNSIKARNDSVDLHQKTKNELSTIIQLQQEFNKNIASLNGFLEMEKKIVEFQNLTSKKKDFEILSKELAVISRSVKFNGENVISYLNTNVKDDASLYTLKVNLTKEIENLKNIVAKERTIIAKFLITSENKDALLGFSPEKNLGNIFNLIKEKNIENIYNLKNNPNKLLS